MTEPIIEPEVEAEEVKPAKKAAKVKPSQTQTDKARANALAKIKAAGR